MGTGPPCQAAWSAAAVFTGTVIDITEPPPPPRPETRGGTASARRTVNDPVPLLPWPKRVVRIQLREVLTGVDPGQKEIEIVTGMGGGDCGYAFQSGVDYVVYAYRNSEGRLETGICFRTRPLAQATEDVAYFHAVATAPGTSEIRIVTGPPGASGMPGVRTTIAGAGSHYAASTDTAGQAKFGGLPPGEYKVTAESEGYLPADRTVQLHAKGCAEVRFLMALDRRVTGRVITKDGLPAAGVEVQVRPTQEMGGDSVKTDAEGRYELRHFRAGGYYLGINLNHTPTLENPYTRWFYPGTEDPASAAIVYFAESPETQRFDLTLPDRQKDREIEGIVLWPDGRPAVDARLSVLDPRWLWQAAVAQVSADATGRFRLHVFDGTKYRLHAVAFGGSPNQTISAEPVDIQPGDDPLSLRLALTRPGDSLYEDQRKGVEQFRKRQ
jgi:Carboxypeptidase regulatory-like domain